MTPPAFAPLVDDLRDMIIEHYERRAVPLSTPGGLRTLDTNSTLAPERGRLLLRLLAERRAGAIAGRRVLDLGAGFGALALYFAHLGADVIAIDPHEERLAVAAEIATRHRLAVTVVGGRAQALPFPPAVFDVVVANNSLCYLVESDGRHAALEDVRRVLRPGGWLVLRDPNRLTPRDPFTGLAGLSLLPSALADRAARRLGRHRPRVRLMTPRAGRRELRRAGFVDVHGDTWRRPAAVVSRHRHVVARRSGSATAGAISPDVL